MQRALVLAVVAAAFVPVAGASPKTGFAFGRSGGSIRAFTVAIANDGSVTLYGAATVGRMQLTRLQLANLNRLAVATRFATLPARTLCKNTLPDVATTFIRVGARTVRVHGECVPRYGRLWKALGAAVKLSG
jgi:hypothetical protein